VSNFKKDLYKEKMLCNYLDDVYTSMKFKYKRTSSNRFQHKGVDLIITYKNKVFYIDEKAQLHYLDQKELPTFAFELSYLKKGNVKTGWFLDKKKCTSHYFLITDIKTKNSQNISEGFLKCKITSVDRKKLLILLEKKGLDISRLFSYNNKMREGTNIKKELPHLDFYRQGHLHHSLQLAESPINLILKLKYLIEKKVAKVIYP